MPSFNGLWTSRQQLQALAGGVWPRPPGAPTIGTATQASSTSVSVTFTAPADTGYPANTISAYTVTSSPGGFTATGGSSPLVVTGLTTGTAYTFTVTATNAAGTGAPSAASNSVTPVPQSQQAYTTAGTYSWVAPTSVTSVSVVCVGGGGGVNSTYGAGGGELRYKNNITVVPGNSYTVVVGAAGTRNGSPSYNGGSSSFNTSSCIANGGLGSSSVTGGSGGTGDGGGNGGNGIGPGGSYGSGGGAGGYSGAGGNGGNYGNPTAGSGGGGGGGGSYEPAYNYLNGAAGGGVGLLGQGSNGAAGSGGSGGGGGSGGTNGSNSGGYTLGGAYGGGAGSANGTDNTGGNGGSGAVRIIWPGNTRSFPSTNTGNL